MEIINYFDDPRQDHWLRELERCGWGAGKYLGQLLNSGTFFQAVGEGSRLLMLVDGDELISFCTYARYDELQPTELTPWVGFVYTFPEHRGHRYFGLLLEESERLARQEGHGALYISTDHVGLYEKYGFTFINEQELPHGGLTRVYSKKL